MKKVIYGVLAFAALTFTSCGGAESTDGAIDADKKEEVVVAEYQLDQENSKIEWAGSWIGGQNDGNSHNGVVKITDGTMLQDGEKFNGHFTVDMKTIDVQDLDEASGKPKLQGHLANEDFFNIDKYAVTDVKVMEYIEGNAKLMLIVGGVEMIRTVPIKIETNDKGMTMKGDFSIDFGDAEMKGMTVNPEKPEEGAVSTEIEFKLHAELMKK
ncbi:YceI family protein [Brumimicrobium glaciale]|uniref:YceI family protein n=1 Tax=Brumimicrobium glaciale TaxID=200475 RepID=A0A4Q4KQT3_9FLAO|nr:YceI family protein [Brumimicrobium glaciale]RYM35757.1 YceI family protein [Brumimicrobium glaciale]